MAGLLQRDERTVVVSPGDWALNFGGGPLLASHTTHGPRVDRQTVRRAQPGCQVERRGWLECGVTVTSDAVSFQKKKGCCVVPAAPGEATTSPKDFHMAGCRVHANAIIVCPQSVKVTRRAEQYWY